MNCYAIKSMSALMLITTCLICCNLSGYFQTVATNAGNDESVISVSNESAVYEEETIFNDDVSCGEDEAVNAVAESKEYALAPEPGGEILPKPEDKSNEKIATSETQDSFQIKVKCTAYCSCEKCCGKYAKNRPLDENGNPIVLTASGERAVAGVTVGVDPNTIPLGSKVIINGHEYIAQDTGNPNVVKDNVIDVYFDNHNAATAFGVKYATATIVTS